MGRQKFKKNHWVPQAYLRTFAADDAKTKIWTFSKDKGEPELKPIEKVAVKFYLYAPMVKGKRDYSFERKLGSLEQLFGAKFWHVVSSGFVDLSDEALRKGLALLISVMHLRNPRALNQYNHIHQQLCAVYEQEPELPSHVIYGGKRYELDHASWPGNPPIFSEGSE